MPTTLCALLAHSIVFFHSLFIGTSFQMSTFTPDALIQNLNDEQKSAVLYNEGHSLILAGAGSGKTRVLTTKIAYLLSLGVSPWQIIALTFTNKAAREMRERLEQMVPSAAVRELTVGTFHSCFARVLRKFSSKINYTRNFTIYDSSDSQSLVRQIIKNRELDVKLYPPAEIQARISWYKNGNKSPQMLATDAEWEKSKDGIEYPQLPEIYGEYCRRCQIANAMDFDDLLLNTLRLLASDQEVRAYFQRRFKYILVDEYQDTNRLQDQIIRLLNGEDTRITVVGDDSQSIYAFRGAEIDNILSFQSVFRQAKQFILKKNYRSTQAIVETSNHLISYNTSRIPKDIESVNEMGKKISIWDALTDRSEAAKVASQIKELISRGVSPTEIAVLYRINMLSKNIEEQLRLLSIPCRVYGGLSFFDKKEIKDVMAYLRLIVNPDDDASFLRVCNLPARGIGDKSIERLQRLAQEKRTSLFRTAQNITLCKPVLKKKADSFNEFTCLIQSFAQNGRYMDLVELVDDVIKRSGLEEMYSDEEHEDEHRLASLQEFSKMVRDFEQTSVRFTAPEDGIGMLATFLEQMALATDADTPDTSEAVSLMTMHSSKGLEYEYVFIVGMEKDIMPGDKCQSEKGKEEERRLLYVAITRAKKECQISYSLSRYKYGDTVFGEKSSFLDELPKEFILDNTSGTSFDNSPQPSSAAPAWSRGASALPHKSAGNYTKRIRRTNPDVECEYTNEEANKTFGYSVGDRVKHRMFGIGTVKGFLNSTSGVKVCVVFDQEGERNLIAKFVQLTKV